MHFLPSLSLTNPGIFSLYRGDLSFFSIPQKILHIKCFEKKRSTPLLLVRPSKNEHYISSPPELANTHKKNENNSTTVRSNTDDGDTYIFRQKEREGYMRTYTRLSIGEIIELYGRVVKKKFRLWAIVCVDRFQMIFNCASPLNKSS